MTGSLQLSAVEWISVTWREAQPKIVTRVTACFETFTAISWGDRHMYQLPSGMQIEVQVRYTDAAGNPARVDGDVTWTTSDAAIATAAVDPGDSTRCVIAAIGPVGSAQVTATADADLGSGVRSLVTLLDVSVVAGEAVAGVITVVADPELIP